MDQNEKLVSVKKNISFAFLTNIFDPQDFTFASDNGRKQSNKWVSGKSKKIPLDIANNQYVGHFFKKKKK